MRSAKPNRMKKGTPLLSIHSQGLLVTDRMTRSTEDVKTPRAVTRTTGLIRYLKMRVANMPRLPPRLQQPKELGDILGRGGAPDDAGGSSWFRWIRILRDCLCSEG